MKKLYLFDLDGTLLDTLQDLADATNHILRQNGYPTRTVEEVRAILGNGARCQLQRSLPGEVSEEELDRLLDQYRAYYEAHCENHTRPYERIEPLLTALRQRGCAVAILSNKPDGATKRLCAKYFPGIPAQGQTDTVRRKPAPDGVLALLRQFDCPVEDAVYVGDSEVDLQTAENCGMDSILVTWGFRSREQLMAAGGRVIVDRPEEILEI